MLCIFLQKQSHYFSNDPRSVPRKFTLLKYNYFKAISYLLILSRQVSS